MYSVTIQFPRWERELFLYYPKDSHWCLILWLEGFISKVCAWEWLKILVQLEIQSLSKRKIKTKWRKLTLKSPTVGNALRVLMSNNLVSHTRWGASASAAKRDKDDVQTKCWLSGLWSALIIAILKPGGDPEPRLNYHPISLINVDREISRKVLANRLEQIFPHWIHPNQVDLFGKDSQAIMGSNY